MSHESAYVKHVPCESCGSSDGASLFDDGHTFCHVCHKYTHSEGFNSPPTERSPRLSNMIQGVEPISLMKRGLTEETCRKWGYGVSQLNGQMVQVATYKDEHGKAVCQKVRFADKKFMIMGESEKIDLYGKHLWPTGGKKVIVTEGEIDAMSVSQMQNHKWPVVSIPNGANAAKKALMKSIEWLESFEEIILMFDSDDPGRKAAKECVELFTPGKCKIASLPLKDANEMLVSNRGDEIIKAMWDAKVVRPDGILAGVDLWERINAVPNNDHLTYPFECLNTKFLGARRGEIITFCAGSGVGKSALVRQITHHFLKQHNETVGLIFLEEGVEETGLHFMGLELGKRLNLDRSVATEEEQKKAFDATLGSGRVFLYDHFGSTDSDNLFNKIRYLVKGCGCRTIVLDHLSIVVSGIEDGDERRLIDNIMTKLACMVQELRCTLLLISHLKKPDGTPFEEGGQITLDHLRGSASIKQLSFDIIACERNQQDEEKKNLTHLRSLKCRRTGRTGSCGYVKYDDNTGLLSEVSVFDDEPTPPTDNKDF